uniref:ER membrane protein complex subunit 9 n=1 Tax=Macaca fascicularis TaxID=9541 RepID=A0A7N9CD11_MACFA
PGMVAYTCNPSSLGELIWPGARVAEGTVNTVPDMTLGRGGCV